MELKLSSGLMQKQKIEDRDYDVIIIGGGPAGYSAALYIGRYKLKALLITKDIGGTLNETHVIEDYPGFNNISGVELAKLLKEQADRWNVPTLIDSVEKIEKENEKFVIYTANNDKFYSKSVIIATGSKRNTLGVPGENLAGVSYCAECDAPLFKDKIVAVVGGGNSAFHDALVLAEHAKKVYIIHRRDEFRADPVYIDEAKKNKKIEFILNKVVSEIKGNNKIEKVILKDTKTGEFSELPLEGLFVAIGLSPVSYMVKDLGVQMDQAGHIIVDDCARTNIPGVAAAGDVTTQLCNFRQVVTAAAQGSLAALTIFKYIKLGKWK